MHFMVIEHFKGGNATPVYHRFRAQGRLAPEGLTYVTSHVTSAHRHTHSQRRTRVE